MDGENYLGLSMPTLLKRTWQVWRSNAWMFVFLMDDFRDSDGCELCDCPTPGGGFSERGVAKHGQLRLFWMVLVASMVTGPLGLIVGPLLLHPEDRFARRYLGPEFRQFGSAQLGQRR
jgi:hypothetical protein